MKTSRERKRAGGAALLAAVIATAAIGSGTALAGGGADTILVSRTTAGDPASGAGPSISDSGRYVGFFSRDDALPGTAGVGDAYVRDTQTGTTTQEDVTSGGDPADGGAYGAAISGSGRYVAFRSSSTNLPGYALYQPQIYVHDRESGTTTLASTTSDGTPAHGDNNEPSISDDGRYVAFQSTALNMPLGNGKDAVYVHDMETGATALASVNSAGERGRGDSNEPSISGNGRYVAFRTKAGNLPGLNGVNGIYRHDLETGETELASRSSKGAPSKGFNESVTISESGRYVGFDSPADNLAGQGFPSAYLRDMTKGRTFLLDRTPTGKPAKHGSAYNSSVSGSGRYAAFVSNQTGLPEANGKYRLYRHDVKTGRVEVIGKGFSGGNVVGGEGELSDTGDYVAFQSSAVKLPDGSRDIRVYERGPLN